MPPALVSPGLGRVGPKGVSVPHAPMPHVIGHGCGLELAALSMGVAPLVPEETVSTGNAGSTPSSRSTSRAVPERQPVVC